MFIFIDSQMISFLRQEYRLAFRPHLLYYQVTPEFSTLSTADFHILLNGKKLSLLFTT